MEENDMAIFVSRRKLRKPIPFLADGEPCRTMINNSDAYRCLQGEYVHRVKQIPKDDPRREEYRRIIDELE